jgi:hypothetical protein
MLIYKSASRHHSVHFLTTSTFKRVPRIMCFHILVSHFDLQTCFAPQPRGLFNKSAHKVLRSCGNFAPFAFEMCFTPQEHALFLPLNFQKTMNCFLTCLIQNVLRTTAAQFLISFSARWLRTRRSSEPTFRPSGALKDWKRAVFATFLPFRARTLIFFLALLSLFSPLLLHLSMCWKV